MQPRARHRARDEGRAVVGAELGVPETSKPGANGVELEAGFVRVCGFGAVD